MAIGFLGTVFEGDFCIGGEEVGFVDQCFGALGDEGEFMGEVRREWGGWDVCSRCRHVEFVVVVVVIVLKWQRWSISLDKIGVRYRSGPAIAHISPS